MKKLISLIIISLIIIVLIMSCSKRNGEILMDSKGNFYQLRPAFGDEAYQLIPLDTNKVKPIGFCK